MSDPQTLKFRTGIQFRAHVLNLKVPSLWITAILIIVVSVALYFLA